MLAFLEQYIMQARFLHISYPEHVHRQETLKGVPQSRIPSILELPAYSRGDAGGAVKTEGLTAEGRGVSELFFISKREVM